MPTPVFPTPNANRLLSWRGLSWGLVKKVMLKNQRQTSVTGRDAVQQLWSRPKYEIALKWSFLRNARAIAANATPSAPLEEYRRLLGFFLARKGSFEPFFLSFTTDGDFYTSNELITASTPAVAADPRNPDSRNYQMVRTFGGVVGPVGGVDVTTSIPVVTVNGSPLTYLSGFTVNDPKDGWIRLASAPSTGSEIRATFHYYYRVAFKRDDLEVEAFADDFWRAKSVLMESRWW